MESLSFICGGLGMIEEDDDSNRIGYAPGEYCLDNLKDLLRFLRRDDPETREVFKQVCKWNTVGKDIVPIIEHCQNDTNLVLNAVKVLVFLTMPIEPTSKDIPQQIDYLWGLKSLITSSHIVPVIMSLLESPLEHLEGDLFTEDDWKLVQLVMTLFRNILAVQDISMQQRVCGSASEFIFLRDRFLQLLFEENVMDLVLVLTQHVGGDCRYFRQDNLLLLETFYYIFKGQDPELIARSHLNGTKVEGEAEATVTDLKSMMEDEKENRRRTRLCNLVSHSQFSGSFTRLTMDGSKTLFRGNPCSDSRDSLLKDNKIQCGPSKKVIWDSGRMPTTNKNILGMLHDFTNQFLSGGYNVLMQSIREDIEKEHHAIQNSDVVIFFQVAEFCMSFQHHKLLSTKPDTETSTPESSINHDADRTLFKGNICGPVAESMNESMFLLLASKWRLAFEGLKETNNYKFLSAAGSLMKIMMRLLDLVLKLSPEDSKEPQTARVLLYKLFYDQTEQGMTHFLFNLIKSFNAHRQPKSDLADLIETIHVVIRLMETLQTRGTLRVSKKSRKKRKKKASTPSKNDVQGQVNAQNGHVVSGGEKHSDVGMLTKERPQDSDIDKNGDEDIIVPGQSNTPETTELETQNTESNMPQMENKKSENATDDYVSDVSSADEQPAAINEVDFKVSSLVSALANNTIIQNLCWLLKFYKSNSIRTNHYIICALRRICEDMELSPMLYQLSLLTTFHSILDEQRSSPCKEHQNIVIFLASLVRRMMRKMKSYPLLFVEVLFWKTRKESHYINCESMLQDLGNLRKEYRKWGNDCQDGKVGNAGSSGGNRWTGISIADALGDDEADVVIPHWRHDDQSEENSDESQVQKRLKRSNLSLPAGKESVNEGTEGLQSRHFVEQERKRAYKRLKPFVLDDELEEKLKNLYDKYKDSQNCSHLIAAELNLEVSPAQISKKLKQLGFKLPTKKRMHDKDSSKIHGEDMEDSSLKQTLSTRKRVRAFSKDQELKIRTLFEQFKDQKKCSHMIASALDGDHTFTAAQISRKLRQLGLRLPKQKRSDDNLHLRDDEDGTEFRTEDSDMETLMSLKRRSKRKQDTDPTGEIPNQNAEQLSEDSDGILLSSAFRSKRKQDTDPTGEIPNQNAEQLSEDSDGILLSSAFRSKRKQDTDPTGGIPNQNAEQLSEDSDGILLSSAFRIGHKSSLEVQAAESEGSSRKHNKSDLEAEATKTGSGQQEGDAITDKVDHIQDWQLSDELADDLTDSENSATLIASQTTAASRRNLRMVIDADDDDD